MSNKVNLENLSSEEHAAIEARREYQRKWRSGHKENVREHNRRYRLKKAKQAFDKQDD
ncbi:MAG: phosphatase [Lachnospiraceae bacterium]|nr:phosphatase [Ruminococcus sp.]MCM1275003.1 phosphatase [Lachnospiraceae bacterium]